MSYMYSNEELLDDLKRFGEELGRTPKSMEVEENYMMASRSTYFNRFGSYSKACKLAGLKPLRSCREKELRSCREKEYSRIENLGKLAKKIGRTPSTREVDKGDE